EALVQSDMKSRLEALALGRQNGIYSPNDVRRKLEENAIPTDQGGDLYYMNGNMVPLTAVTRGHVPLPSSGEPEPAQVVMCCRRPARLQSCSSAAWCWPASRSVPLSVHRR